MPTPRTPIALSPPIPAPKPLLETKPGRPERVEDVAEAVEAGEDEEEEVMLAAEEEEVGRVRDGAASEGFVSVVKQGPNRFRQLPFFFFFTPSSPPAAAIVPPIPSPLLEAWDRL